MTLDFPRAWELARAAPLEAHDPECSYVQTDGALLCDLVCPVIANAPEYRCAALHSVGGKIPVMGRPSGWCSCGGAR